ncbi:MAG: hypothetical protein JSU86_20140 [Phycisphaerales bacterium]|nr:MAG: hypothetical protein JSU86_20140 [Phycisphaerales bacterium]
MAKEASAQPAHELGIEPLGLRLSAAGYMLDFRYRVTDPQRALPIVSRATKPYLIDESTGAKLFIPNPPKVGPLRQTSREPEVDKTYFVLFANPGRFIKEGDSVSVAFGECKLENIVVE